MKKSKRPIALILCIVLLLLFTLVGCGKKKNKTDESVEVYDPNKGIDFNSEKKYIISNGTANYKIVIANNASAADEFAAEEMRAFAEEISGVSLEIVSENDLGAGEKYISIGSTTVANAVDTSELKSDGFKIQTREDAILIKGASDRANIYGVYDFAEKFMGVKFLTPDYTYVPKSDTVFTYTLDIVEDPSFEIRGYFAENIIYNGLFAARMRMIAPYDTNQAKYGGGYLSEWNTNELHSIFELLPPEIYGNNEGWYTNDKKQICLTHGLTDDDEIDQSMANSVIKQAIENVKKKIEENPTIKYFMIGQPDIVPACSCSRCTASNARNGGKSGTLLIFINQIAKVIEDWLTVAYPQRSVKIVTFAYQWSAAAPVKYEGDNVLPYNEKVKPRDNVVILLAPIEACYYHSINDSACTVNAYTNTIFKNWTAIAKNVMIWDYQINFVNHFWYFPNTRVLKDNLCMYEKNGIKMTLSQAAPRESKFYQADLDCYLFSKLMWNPYRDVNKLIEEFNYYYYYGEKYGAYVAQYSDLMERHFAILDARDNFHTDLYDNTGSFFAVNNYPIELLEKAEEYLTTAIGEAQNDPDLSESEKSEMIYRLTKVIVTPQMMILKNYNTYYSDGLTDYAEKFFDNLTLIGAKNYAENSSVEDLKKQYGL